ncbi:glucose-6-phosphate isomerase [Marinobacter zhanjiangensis]|uniref:Glucose-6-phosphate isomerase n=1 Tax=Marinobacter zhanjiangensis TaxID=578215 RepID=A0ABQ3B7V2_9GAMM|nr:glucose-6-phosphate isomerase [Marinobacter zhanjiangensis]GGY83469.1 glucose-6-phosphate isomerase [Marinobacter zhanjiangensis]
MTTEGSPLVWKPEWQALREHQAALTDTHMRALFRDDPERFHRFSIQAAGLRLDYSKNRINHDTLPLLTALARACGLPDATEAMFSGTAINNTENRPALHTALRAAAGSDIRVSGENIVPEVQATLDRMESFVERVHGGELTGFRGDTLTDIVSIGIGGSYLGPRMITEALKPLAREGIRCHYVANIDGTDISEVLRQVRPETTLFLVQSKSFSTQETLANSQLARQWLRDNGASDTDLGHHFVAVTANAAAAREFGIHDDAIFPMWDWVGGRYSLWSAIGLPIALTLGMDHFRRLLAGARAMDNHFRHAPLQDNMPVVMALLGVWYVNFWGADSHTILTYDEYLKNLPNHLQQLDMESNGKRVDRDGRPVDYATGPVIWGGVGANGQHAYHQLLHQGTVLSPADFIIPLNSHNPVANHHATLFANCLAQSQALMQGKTEDEARTELQDQGLPADEVDRLAPHKVVPGNKPSNTLVFDKASPETIGALVALYEHRTFVQGVIWNLNSFDQWGVELGKQLGKPILQQLNEGITDVALDSSTAGLMKLFRGE